MRLSFFAVLTAATLALLSGPGRAAVPGAPPIPKAPNVNARAYILVDHFSGRILAEDHADQREEPASLTKLMTSYAVFKALKENRLKLTDPITISEHAWRSEGSRTFVQVGSVIPAEVLIKGMIVQSGNDATIALAEKVGGTEPAFAQLMNEYAKRLGMKSTNFVNADGLPDPNHYTTARDMAVLANALISEFPEYYPWYSIHEFTWNNIKQQNRNGLLLRDPTVDGMKTGHTDSAGFCLVTSAKRDNMRLVSVVLGSSSIKAREDASAALLNYGYTFYETAQVKKAGEVLLKPRVYKSADEYLTLTVPRNIVLTVGRGQIVNLKSTAHILKEPLIAPLAANQPIGELTITDQAGEVVSRVPLTPGKAVPEAGIWTRATDSVRLWFN
ncbi:MAG TPA: D-alanyl-D-alanine carboxypeptidase family protein [Steroidobacteraceae bacterium]|nr:D-alanyl-D-alanine carboxypeptidase family protein [Steroidobacteraceae bacterium]